LPSAETHEDERRTKIVATIGPASREPEVLRELISAGADVLRLNFAHGSREEHAETVRRIRAASQEVGREVGVLGDLPGPKLRLGSLPGDVVELAEGDQAWLVPDSGSRPAPAETATGAQLPANWRRTWEVPDSGPRPTTAEQREADVRLPVSWRGLPHATQEGDPVYLADGRIRLRVLSERGEDVLCRVEVGGPVASHQGINLPGAGEALPAAGEADLDWIDFASEHGFDLLAVSFVRSASDLEGVSARLRERGADIPLIAKIEKPQAAENAEEIARAADSGIMVARGDLGIELPLTSVPVVQKRLIRLAGRLSKPTITATQMLASMVTSDRPTRAEVTDVANAIYDGTDAVMLSEETAIGRYPVEAVAVTDRIARDTESDLPYEEWLFNRTAGEEHDVADSVAQGAVAATYRLGLAALVVPTTSGRTARLVSALRPRVPVLAVSPRIGTVRRLKLLFGVRSAEVVEWTSLRQLLDDCASLARDAGVASSGDLIAITAGLPEQELGTNLFEVHRVP
jgi:pyruvate kinase